MKWNIKISLQIIQTVQFMEGTGFNESYFVFRQFPKA